MTKPPSLAESLKLVQERLDAEVHSTHKIDDHTVARLLRVVRIMADALEGVVIATPTNESGEFCPINKPQAKHAKEALEQSAREMGGG